MEKLLLLSSTYQREEEIGVYLEEVFESVIATHQIRRNRGTDLTVQLECLVALRYEGYHIKALYEPIPDSEKVTLINFRLVPLIERYGVNLTTLHELVLSNKYQVKLYRPDMDITPYLTTLDRKD